MPALKLHAVPNGELHAGMLRHCGSAAKVVFAWSSAANSENVLQIKRANSKPLNFWKTDAQPEIYDRRNRKAALCAALRSCEDFRKEFRIPKCFFAGKTSLRHHVISVEAKEANELNL